MSGAGLLKPVEAAQYLGIGVKHLRKLVDLGRVRYIDVGAGRVNIRRMFDPADLDDFIEQQRRIVQQAPIGKGKRRPQQRVGVACPSRDGRGRRFGTTDFKSKVVAFSDLLERAAAVRQRT